MQTESFQAGNPSLVMPYRGLTIVTAILVLIQAALAGQGWFKGDADFINFHEIVGNIFFLSVVLQAGVTVMLRLRGSLRSQLLALNAALLVLTFAQIGLGYSGRESAQAAAWHIPNGVLLFGIGTMIAILAMQLRRE
jgi:hypothetical protein